jgi:hypothetical protein
MRCCSPSATDTEFDFPSAAFLNLPKEARMAAPRPKSNLRRFLRPRVFALATFVAVMLLLLTLGAIASRDNGLTLGATMISLEFDPTHPQSAMFEHTVWDGPTGEFSSGHNFRLKLPTGVLFLRLENNPLEVIRRRLPDTVPELTQLLSSQNHFEVWCAAESLAKMKQATVPALPALCAAAEKYVLGPTWQSIEEISLAAPQLAAPLIIPWLSSTNLDLRLSSAELLGKLGTNSIAAAPILRAHLESATDPMHKFAYAHAHFQITRDASPTIPVLRYILQNATPIEQVGVLLLLPEYGTNAASLSSEVRLLAATTTNVFLKNAATRALRLISTEH